MEMFLGLSIHSFKLRLLTYPLPKHKNSKLVETKYSSKYVSPTLKRMYFPSNQYFLALRSFLHDRTRLLNLADNSIFFSLTSPLVVSLHGYLIFSSRKGFVIFSTFTGKPENTNNN